MGSLALILLSNAVAATLAWALATRRERGRWLRLERIKEAEREEAKRIRSQRGGVRMKRYLYRRPD